VTRPDARLLVTRLVAAFPFPQPPRSTLALYVERFERLADEGAASRAVDGLIDTADRFPTIAAVLNAYRAELRAAQARNAAVRGLEEPPADPENARRARELLDRIRLRGMDDEAA